MKKKDPLTNEEFEPKRSNQRFANATNRIKYHNRESGLIRKAKAYIDKPLQRNHRILTELMTDVVELKVHKEFLMGKGYDFNLITHIEQTGATRSVAVYRYVISQISNNFIQIKKI